MAQSEEVWSKVEENVEKYGWHAMGVFPTVDDPEEIVPFEYTIGLWDELGHPEILITGLDGQTAHAVLAGAIDIINGGTPLEVGPEYDDIIREPYKVCFREVPVEHIESQMGWSLEYHRRKGGSAIRALQLVWPDPDGKFPWDEGYAYDAARQPLWTLPAALAD